MATMMKKSSVAQQRPACISRRARPVVCKATRVRSAAKSTPPRASQRQQGQPFGGTHRCLPWTRPNLILATPLIAMCLCAAQESPFAGLGQKLASAGAAAMLTLGSLSGAAVASEFDVMAESAPSTHYYVDDANVLSKSSKGDIDKKLKLLEVGSHGSHGPGIWYIPGVACSACAGW